MVYLEPVICEYLALCILWSLYQWLGTHFCFWGSSHSYDAWTQHCLHCIAPLLPYVSPHTYFLYLCVKSMSVEWVLQLYNQHGTIMFSASALNWKCYVRCDQWEWKDRSFGNTSHFRNTVYESLKGSLSHSFELDGLNHVHHYIYSSSDFQKAVICFLNSINSSDGP
jgi:hypothetical protein